MTQIKTGSWFAPIPDDHLRVAVSRGTPRGFAAGYRKYMKLAPGPWFKSVSPQDYLTFYGEILGQLDPQRVHDELLALGGGKTPVLTCYESVAKIQTGETWCHRHLAGKFLTDRLGLEIEEVGAPPDFNPWALLQKNGIAAPTFK